jgi:YidC/Oxa1 family membrane protein insertase
MERQLLLVFALTFVILIVFQPLLMKYMKKQEPQPLPVATTPAPAASAVSPAATLPVTAPAGAKQAASESEIVIENDLYRISFSNKGAQVKSWILKKYTDDKGQPLELVSSDAQIAVQKDGQVAYEPAVEKYGYPMSLWTYDEGLRSRLNSALYVSSASGVLKTPATLNFEYSDGDLVVHKSFRFDESYLVHVESEVTSRGQRMQAFPAWPAGFGDQVTVSSYTVARIGYQFGDKTTRIDAKKVSGGGTIHGPFNWAGVADQYFGAIFLPDQPDDATLVTLNSSAVISKNFDKNDMKETVPVSLLGAAVGNANGPTEGRWFVGPKAVDVIDNIRSTPAAGQGVGPNLSGLVDFGFFGWVGKPLFLALRWTHQHVAPNWGWSIVVLTIVINAALLPLRITSMKSALKMQKVQPLINDIKKKYEKIPMRDPRKQEMNAEIGALFKEHGVNPAGGCLPMLIQMPFLWAFYTMLTAAIELRHAHWLWIKDLGSPDPYHVLPVLIIASTWGMQKMTPTPGMDPAQAKMMNLMMPVMLGIFSWAVAAGLGVYWLVGTVIAVVTQQALNRTSLGQEMRSIAEKRARRKAMRS